MSAPLCLPFARVSLRASQRLPAGLQPPGVLHRRQRDAPSGSVGPVRFGGSEERGGGWRALARALPTGRAGIGVAKLIAAVLPSRFGFIQGTRNAMSRSLKRHFQPPGDHFSILWR